VFELRAVPSIQKNTVTVIYCTQLLQHNRDADLMNYTSETMNSILQVVTSIQTGDVKYPPIYVCVKLCVVMSIHCQDHISQSLL
jgi:hypothetical protein